MKTQEESAAILEREARNRIACATNKEIGVELGIPPKSVSNRINAIVRRILRANRAKASNEGDCESRQSQG